MRILTLQTVLVATDLRDASLPAIKAARALAHAAGGQLHVVHVGSNAPEKGEATHAQLGEMGIPLHGASVHTVAGEPAQGILRLANELCADVIVIGPHEDRGGPAGVGTALEVADQARVPCLVIGSIAPIPVMRAIVADDGSDTARGAMVLALSWASGLRRAKGAGNVKLTALHVAQSGDDAARERLETGVQQLKNDAGSWAGVDIDSVVIAGDDVAATISSYVRTHAIDFVVLGTHGTTGIRPGRLGSVAAAVARQIDVPVLLIPPAIWEAYTKQRDVSESNAA